MSLCLLPAHLIWHIFGQGSLLITTLGCQHTLFHWMGMLDPGSSEASRTRQGRGQANRSGLIETSDAIGSAWSLGCLAELLIARILPWRLSVCCQTCMSVCISRDMCRNIAGCVRHILGHVAVHVSRRISHASQPTFSNNQISGHCRTQAHQRSFQCAHTFQYMHSREQMLVKDTYLNMHAHMFQAHFRTHFHTHTFQDTHFSMLQVCISGHSHHMQDACRTHVGTHFRMHSSAHAFHYTHF